LTIVITAPILLGIPTCARPAPV